VTSIDLPGLARNGELAIGVFSACIFLWATEALPLMITSILALVSFPALGILETHATYALFGNEVTFFILGVFILASPLQRSGLSTRITVRVLDRFGNTPGRLISAILGLTAAMSCVMSCHAVAAIFLPVVQRISSGLKLPSSSRYGKSLYLALAYGSIIGGTATLLGSGRAPLAVAILQENSTTTISFVDWALLATPIMLGMLLCTRWVLHALFPSEIEDISGARDILAKQVDKLGKISYREIATSLLLCTTIVCWILAGDSIGLATIALLAVVVAFVIGCARWQEVEEDVNWGIVLMYGGAIALGMGMLETGASTWLADQLLAVVPSHSALLLLILVAVVAMWLTEGISNAAAVALFMPPMLGLAARMGIDPRMITVFVALSCGYAMVLPMGTPGMALAFTGGFLRPGDTARAGTLLKCVACILLFLAAVSIWPWLGYEV
jgi:sodium-dependent dicarboxylate transporter 2/3/5